MIRIAVLDTDAELKHSIFSNIDIHIDTNYAAIGHGGDGHGTAICGIIAKEMPSAKITLYPIFPSSEDGIDSSVLRDTLEYLYQKNNCDVINLSCGILMLDGVEELHEICRKLRKRGVWIVSGFHNLGVMSYPACFEEVIGVDQTTQIKKIKEYYWIENSPINVLGYAHQQRVAWVNNSYILARGTSFIVPYITCRIAQLLEKKHDVTEGLQKDATVIKQNKTVPLNRPNFSITNAVLFPFNKEMHALIRFQKHLNFTITGIYDVKYFYNIGRKPEDIIGIASSGLNKIKNITNICWEDDFDTLVIGHIDQLFNYLGVELFESIVEQALRHEKNIYTFDKNIYDIAAFKKEVLCSKSKIFYPSLECGCLEGSHQGRMWVHNTPIVGIFGTSSKQGKYTLQISLGELLNAKGYKTAQLSTEPNGWLLNADAVYHFGYGNAINISERESIILLNQMLHSIEMEKNPDIIIAASQSGTIPFNNYVFSCISIAQTAFLHGIAPDATILCVNMDDDIDYIRRTIKHIEAYVDTRLIAIVVYPYINEMKYGGFMNRKRVENIEEMELFSSSLSKIFDGCIVMGNHIENYILVASAIEEYFTDK